MFHKLFPYFVSGATSKGHRLQTPSWYKYTKSVEPYLCLFSIVRFRNDLSYKNKQETPTPNMNSHQTEPSRRMLCGGIIISQRAFTAFLFRIGWNFPDFTMPKQALINAFYYVYYPSPLMCRHPQRRFTGAKVHNYFGLCKYLFVYVKKKLYFCTKIATEKQNDR